MIAMPDPSTFARCPWRPNEAGVARMFCDIQTPERTPVRGRPAARPAPRARARRADGLRSLLRRPRARVLLLPRLQVDRGARRGRLLRPDDARRRLGPAARDGARARAARDPHRVHPPRGRPQPARDRHALRRRAEDGRRLHDLPDHGQGIRDEVRPARDLHAQAAVRQERLRDAHAPVAVPRRAERVLRRRRPVLPVRRRQGVHRRPAAPRARDLLDLRPVGQLLQAAGARLRGAGVRGLVAAQPLGAGARAAVSPRPGARDADGAALPRPGVQPVPDLRGAAAGRARGDRARLRAARPDGEEPLPPVARRAPPAGDRAAARDARRGDRADRRVRARAAHARRAHVQPLHRDQAPGVGRLPRPGHSLGAERYLPVL